MVNYQLLKRMNDASSFIYPDKEIFNKQEMLVLMEEMINSKYNKKLFKQ